MADVSINTVTKLLVDVLKPPTPTPTTTTVVVMCGAGVSSATKNLVLCGCEKEEGHAGAKQQWVGVMSDLDGNRRLYEALRFLPRRRSADGGWGLHFMQDVASRVRGRVQLTTDGHKPYLEAVRMLGVDVRHAVLPQDLRGSSDEEVRR